MSNTNNLALVSPVSRPERKLDDVVLVFPGNVQPNQDTFHTISAMLLKHGAVIMRSCACGTTFVSGYEVAVEEAEAIHLKTLCPLLRKQPRKA